MSEQPPHPPGTLKPYACSQILYRAVLRKEWWRPGRTKVKKQAFFRYNIDTKGMSVNPHPRDAYENIPTEIFGFVTIHVGRLRDMGLDVIPDRPDHGNIIDVPTRDENLDEAFRIGELLANHARPVTEEELSELMRQPSPID